MLEVIIIHHLDGLFGPNILTSSQLPCQLSWQSTALVSQRSWVQIPYRPEFFSGPIFNYQFSSVLSCKDLLNLFLHHSANTVNKQALSPPQAIDPCTFTFFVAFLTYALFVVVYFVLLLVFFLFFILTVYFCLFFQAV